jgi:hypothetical protein
MIFMRAKGRGGDSVRKYVMTKFGNLRLVSDKKIQINVGAPEGETNGDGETEASEE